MRYIQVLLSSESELPVEDLLLPNAGEAEIQAIEEAADPAELEHPAVLMSYRAGA